jgi:uncharacterized protein (DUF1697 family)
MPTHIALLRAVNLPGHNKVSMKELCALFGKLGFANTGSLLQSGNIVFDGGAYDTAKLETLLEDETKKALGVETDYFVRAGVEWKRMIAALPFPDEAKSDPSHLAAFVLKQTPMRGAERKLNEAIKGHEYARVVGASAYIVYPDGFGRSKLTNAVVEKALGVRGTARNWNTVLKLAALV